MTLQVNDKIKYFTADGKWEKGFIAGIMHDEGTYLLKLYGRMEGMWVNQDSNNLRRLNSTWRDKPKFFQLRNTFLVGDTKDYPKINQALRECFRQTTAPLDFRRAWVTVNTQNGPCLFEITKKGLKRTIPTFAKVARSQTHDIYLRQSWKTFD